MKISALTFMALYINRALDSCKYVGVSIDTVWEGSSDVSGTA